MIDTEGFRRFKAPPIPIRLRSHVAFSDRFRSSADGACALTFKMSSQDRKGATWCNFLFITRAVRTE